MKRLECLDGLRGLLAVYVLLGHMAPFALLPDLIQTALSHGGAAVDLFFVLSGLVITQSLVRSGGQARPFLIARATRIFPVFLLVFALAVAVDPWSCGFERMPWVGPDSPARTICIVAGPHAWLLEVAAHLTMTHGLFPNGVLKDVWVSFLGSAWSLSTEWQFYMLALLVAGVCRQIPNLHRAGDATDGRPDPVAGPAFSPRRRPFMFRYTNDTAPRGLIHPQTLCWVLLLVAAAGVVWRLATPETWQFSRAFLPNKGHFFALGVASVPVIRREHAAIARYGMVLVVSLAICATQDSMGKLLPPLAWTACLAVQMLPGCVAARLTGVQLTGLQLTGAQLPGWVLRSPVAQYLGAISYCLYLVNEPIHKVIVAPLVDLADADAMIFTLLWIPAAVGLPIVASIWLHRHIEVPAQKWGRSAAGRLAVGGLTA